MDEANLKVVFRDVNWLTDPPCIYATWRNASFYSSVEKRSQPAGHPKRIAEDYFRAKTQEIKETLSKPDVRIKIACLENDPNTIIGYCISRGTHLDWIYVKEAFRKQGIGQAMLPKQIDSYTQDLTKIGQAILKAKKNLKENPDEEDTRELKN